MSRVTKMIVMAASALVASQSIACPKIDKTKISAGFARIIQYDDMKYKSVIRVQQKNDDEALVSFVYRSPAQNTPYPAEDQRGSAEVVCVENHWAIEKITFQSPNYYKEFTIPVRIY